LRGAQQSLPLHCKGATSCFLGKLSERTCRKSRGQRELDHPQMAQISQIPEGQICVNRRNLRIRCFWLRPKAAPSRRGGNPQKERAYLVSRSFFAIFASLREMESSGISVHPRSSFGSAQDGVCGSRISNEWPVAGALGSVFRFNHQSEIINHQFWASHHRCG